MRRHFSQKGGNGKVLGIGFAKNFVYRGIGESPWEGVDGQITSSGGINSKMLKNCRRIFRKILIEEGRRPVGGLRGGAKPEK